MTDEVTEHGRRQAQTMTGDHRMMDGLHYPVFVGPSDDDWKCSECSQWLNADAPDICPGTTWGIHQDQEAAVEAGSQSAQAVAEVESSRRPTGSSRAGAGPLRSDYTD